jgi:hypothetical protein
MAWIFQLPPLPKAGTATSLGIAAAIVLAGALLAMRGRKLGAVVMVIIGAAAGFIVGGMVAQSFKINELGARVGCAMAMAVAGLYCASGLWTLLLAGAGGVVAIAVLTYQSAVARGEAPPAFESSADELGRYFRDLFDYIWRMAKALWHSRRWDLVIYCGAAMGVPIFAAIFVQRLVTIVSTAFFGALAVVGGVFGAVILLRPSAAASLGRFWHAIAGIVAGMMLVGIIMQLHHKGARKGPPQGDPATDPPPRVE